MPTTMKIHFLTIIILPLIFCSCASPHSHQPTQIEQRPTATAPVPQKTPPAVKQAEPQIDAFARMIKQLEAENSELRMQLLENVLTH